MPSTRHGHVLMRVGFPLLPWNSSMASQATEVAATYLFVVRNHVLRRLSWLELLDVVRAITRLKLEVDISGPPGPPAQHAVIGTDNTSLSH